MDSPKALSAPKATKQSLKALDPYFNVHTFFGTYLLLMFPPLNVLSPVTHACKCCIQLKLGLELGDLFILAQEVLILSQEVLILSQEVKILA